MTKRWIVVADKNMVLVYGKRREDHVVSRLRSFHNPAAQIFNGENAPDYWQRRFAREASAMLELEAHGEYEELIVVGEKQFLRLLIDTMGPNARGKLVRSIEKDVSGFGEDEIESSLAELAG